MRPQRKEDYSTLEYVAYSEALKNSFSPTRTIPMWNSLPSSVVSKWRHEKGSKITIFAGHNYASSMH